MTHQQKSGLSPSSSAGSRLASPRGVDLAALTLARTVINTSLRMAYPFLPALSRGLGVTPGAVRLLVGARSAAGFASPLFGPLSDRFGRRAAMFLALAVLTLGLVLISIRPVYGVALVAFVLFGLAKVIFDPAMQAYIGDRVPYERRGMAMGVVEISWSAALLLGAPLAGLAIQHFGWVSPFVGLAVLGAFSVPLLWAVMPRDEGIADAHVRNGFARVWTVLSNQPAALGALSFAVLVGLANEIMFVLYGEWMETSFGLRVSTLGLLTAVIGLGELAGELAVAVGSDRVGKRRVVLVGLVLSALAYGGLPWLSASLVAALAMLFVMFVSFEAMVVGSIPFVSEIVPSARGTMMAAYLMGFLVGRIAGALAGGWLSGLGGFVLPGAVAAIVNLVAVIVVVALFNEAGMRTREVTDALA